MKTKAAAKRGGDNAVGRQPNALGKAARNHIVAMAERLLIEDGYHRLSTRRVADACGISVGNLTYHFRNKALLVEAVMLSVCERYAAQRKPMRAEQAQAPAMYLRATIEYMLNDAVEPETSALFVELWVLAKHHAFGVAIVERFYATVIGWLVEALEACFPAAPANARERAAYFLLTLSEGSVALFSRPYARPVDHADMVDFAVAGVTAMLGSFPGREGSSEIHSPSG